MNLLLMSTLRVKTSPMGVTDAKPNRSALAEAASNKLAEHCSGGAQEIMLFSPGQKEAVEKEKSGSVCYIASKYIGNFIDRIDRDDSTSNIKRKTKKKRAPFKPDEIKVLKEEYENCSKFSDEIYVRISNIITVDYQRVKQWFFDKSRAKHQNKVYQVKSKDQTKVLEEEYMKCSKTNVEKYNRIARETGLNYIQICHWFAARRRKDKKAQSSK